MKSSWVPIFRVDTFAVHHVVAVMLVFFLWTAAASADKPRLVAQLKPLGKFDSVGVCAKYSAVVARSGWEVILWDRQSGRELSRRTFRGITRGSISYKYGLVITTDGIFDLWTGHARRKFEKSSQKKFSQILSVGISEEDEYAHLISIMIPEKTVSDLRNLNDLEKILEIKLYSYVKRINLRNFSTSITRLKLPLISLSADKKRCFLDIPKSVYYSRDSRYISTISTCLSLEKRFLVNLSKNTKSTDFEKNMKEESNLNFFDSVTGNLLRRIVSPQEYDQVKFSVANSEFLALSGNGEVQSWNWRTQKLIRTYRIPATTREPLVINQFSLSSDGRYLAASCSDGAIRIWDVKNKKILPVFTPTIEAKYFEEEHIQALQFMPGESRLISAVKGAIDIFEVPSGERENVVRLDHVRAYDAEFSPGGRFLCSDKGVWDMTEGSFRGDFAKYLMYKFLPGDQRFICEDDEGNWQIRSLSGEVLKSKPVSYDDPTSICTDIYGNLYILYRNGKVEVLDDNLRDLAPALQISEKIKYGWPNIACSRDGRYLLLNKDTADEPDGVVALWDIKTRKLLKNWMGKSYTAQFSSDGMRLFVCPTFDLNSPIQVYNLNSHAVENKIYLPKDNEGEFWSPSSFGITGSEIITDDGQVIQLANKKVTRLNVFKESGESVWSEMCISPDGKWLVGLNNQSALEVWDVKRKKLTAILLSFEEPRKKFGKFLLTPLDEITRSWAVIDPEGRFDGPDGGNVSQLHWVWGADSFELSQLGEGYYVHQLLRKLLQGEPMKTVVNVGHLDHPPAVDKASLRWDKVERVLTGRVINRGAGFGEVRVRLNGELISWQSLSSVPRYRRFTNFSIYIPGKKWAEEQDNHFEICALAPDLALENRILRVQPRTVREGNQSINLHAVIVGTSVFDDPRLNLQFASNDARSFALVLNRRARFLLNDPANGPGEHVYIHLLTSDPEISVLGVPKARPATKDEIQRVMLQIGKDAKPGDILLLYFAGHGKSYTVNGASHYAYLTQEASEGAVERPDLRRTRTVTDEDIQSWLHNISASKKALILDTCAAGAFNIDTGVRGNDDSIRAITQLRKNSGMFILMGSPKDRAAYETTQYQHGLLTYSLLEGMQGAALAENDFVEVVDLFVYATRRVEELATQVGLVDQKPQWRTASGGNTSFRIGQRPASGQEADLELPQPIPMVFLESVQSDPDLEDFLHIDSALKAEYRRRQFAAARGDISQTVYFIDRKVSGAFRLHLRYTLEGNRIKLLIVLGKQKSIRKEVTLPITSNATGQPDIRPLVLRILAEVETISSQEQTVVSGK